MTYMDGDLALIENRCGCNFPLHFYKRGIYSFLVEVTGVAMTLDRGFGGNCNVSKQSMLLGFNRWWLRQAWSLQPFVKAV